MSLNRSDFGCDAYERRQLVNRTVKVLLCILVVLGVSAGAWAAPPSIVVETYELQPNQAGQTIRIYVTGGDDVQGLEFNVRIGGGTSGPTFEDVDILSTGSGTIFDGKSTGVNVGSYIDSWDAYQGTTASTAPPLTGYVPADGLLAILTVDTTGLYDGESYSLSLIDTREGKTNFAGVDIDITDGQINIIPEPTSMMIILAGSGLLIRRRRNKNRH